MPRSDATLDRILQDLAWLHVELDPSRCGCRDVRCADREGHARGECPRAPETRIWTHRWEYLCGTCREYYFGGASDGLT